MKGVERDMTTRAKNERVRNPAHVVLFLGAFPASCPLAPPYGFSRYQYAPQAPKGTEDTR